MAVENQKRNVQLQVDADRLRCEKDALELILTSHCRWMKSTERLLQERKPDECRKLAEQCKVSSFILHFYIFFSQSKNGTKILIIYFFIACANVHASKRKKKIRKCFLKKFWF